MFGLSASSILMLYICGIMIVYLTLSGFMPSWLGAKIDYRGKGLRLMMMSLAWGPLIIGSMFWMIVRKNRQIDEMSVEIRSSKLKPNTDEVPPAPVEPATRNLSEDSKPWWQK